MRAPAVEFSQQIADRICESLAAGVSLRETVKADGMPNEKTVYRWVKSRPEFKSEFEEAREFGYCGMADLIREIADDGTNDWMQRQNKDGTSGWALNGENVQRSRLRVDTYKWILAKAMPKIYGDKVTAEVSGPDGGPIEIKDENALARWIALKLTAAAASAAPQLTAGD
jgi:hypothetical protein